MTVACTSVNSGILAVHLMKFINLLGEHRYRQPTILFQGGGEFCRRAVREPIIYPLLYCRQAQKLDLQGFSSVASGFASLRPSEHRKVHILSTKHMPAKVRIFTGGFCRGFLAYFVRGVACVHVRFISQRNHFSGCIEIYA